MNTAAVLDRLDTLIADRSILRHPFYVAWQDGALTRAQLATYATVYWPHVAAFPAYLASAVETARDADATTRDALRRNLEDERGTPRPHADLWLDFASGVGADPGAVTAAPPHPAATRLVETLEALTRDSVGEGLAGLYAYESQQPEVSATKQSGLRDRYGVTEPSTLAYFALHAEMDLDHRRAEREALARALDAGADPEAVETATRQTLDAYWGLLDGVCDAAGIACA